MTLSLYMDHHVPFAITRRLRQRGINVITAKEDHSEDWEDESLLVRATEFGYVVFTQDDDFLSIGREWQLSGRPFAGIIYAHQLRVTIGQAIRELELIARVMSAEEMQNRIEFLPLQ